MTIEQALDTYLKLDATLAALIGTRLYWIQADQTATLPYVVYQNIIDTDEAVSFSDQNTGNARMQFACVGSTKSTKAVAYRIRALLRNIGGTIGGINLLASFPAGMREVYNPDTNRYVFYIDFDITYAY